MKVKQAQKEV